jgi:hypothetical protein
MPSPEMLEQMEKVKHQLSEVRDEAMPFKPFADDFRSIIKFVAMGVKNLMTFPGLQGPGDAVINTAEAKANIMLAYRHLEDATMRLDKAIQATEGGVSCYDKTPAK